MIVFLKQTIWEANFGTETLNRHRAAISGLGNHITCFRHNILARFSSINAMYVVDELHIVINVGRQGIIYYA